MTYIRADGGHGGTGGDAFADDLTEVRRLVGINIWAGEYVDAIQCVFEGTNGKEILGEKRGGSGGDAASFRLEAGETITLVEGRAGEHVDQLEFVTSMGNSHGPYGHCGGQPFRFPLEKYAADVTPKPTLTLGGFYGRDGDLIDNIGFFTLKPA